MRTILNIEKFCQRFGLAYASEGHHHCHQGWVQLHCLFCAGGNSGFHLGFSLEGGNFNCWRCGSHSAWEVIGTVIGSNVGREIGKVFRECSTEAAAEQKQYQRVRERTIAPPPGVGPLGKRHRTYLERRSFSPSKLEQEWDLVGTAHRSLLWSWRIVAPIADSGGRVVAFTGRTVREEKQRWKISDDAKCLIDPKMMIYGIDRCQRSIVVVEGVSDVWRMGPGCGALMGIDWNSAQVNLLRKFENRYILFDPEKRAQRRAQKLANYLSVFSGTTEIIDGLASDPGALPQREADAIMKELVG